ncbi:Lcl C-terminal domain-containing protein [Faucicola boevrei]|uniref:Lcl C-terminal domain-containing protein n=1 Tax=Faucicola boevrei TaxID=346665 RepID=UPI00036A8748|nr:DUF1566 domain-containing protein [Moraxella boevrei]
MKKFTKIALVTATIASSFAIANNLMPETKLATEVLAGDYEKTADTNVFSVDIDNSQVVDKARKLVWSRCLVGQTYNQSTANCDGVATEFDSWEKALNAQKDGWRVPNVKELATLVEETQALPAINTSIFPFGKTLSFYGHADTTETTDRSKWITKSDLFPNEKCIEDASGWYPRWVGEKSGWECINPKLPAKYALQPSSAYIWSATPVANTDATTADKVYGLDLADGSLQIAKRSGEAIGGYQDSANERRARYVILVKDAS